MSLATDPLDARFDAATVKQRSVRGSAVTMAAQLIKFVLQFGSQIILARLLLPAEYGLVALVAPVLGLVQTFNDLGLSQAMVQRPNLTQNQASALFWTNLGIGVLLTGLMAALAPLFAFIYHEPRTVEIVLALSSLILMSSLTMHPIALLNRRMRFLPLAIVEVAAVMVGVAVGVIAALNGYSYWSLVLMQAANSATQLVLAWIFAGWRPSWPRREPEVGSFLKFGAHLTGSNLASYFSISADNVIIGMVSGPAALGLYDRSFRLVLQPLMQVMAPMSRVAIPMLSRLNDAPKSYARAFLTVLQFSLILSMPMMVLCVFAAEPIVLFLLGPNWAAAAPVFQWICLGGSASGLFGAAAWLFTSQGRTREQLHFALATAAINIASFGIGIFWGVTGVAIASATSFILIQTPLVLWAATRKGPVTAKAIAGAVWPFLLAAGCAGIALAGFVAQVQPHGFFGIAAAGALDFVVFGLVLVLLAPGRVFIANAIRLTRSLTGDRSAADGLAI